MECPKAQESNISRFLSIIRRFVAFNFHLNLCGVMKLFYALHKEET